MINIYLNQKTGTRPFVQSCEQDAPSVPMKPNKETMVDTRHYCALYGAMCDFDFEQHRLVYHNLFHLLTIVKRGGPNRSNDEGLCGGYTLFGGERMHKKPKSRN